MTLHDVIALTSYALTGATSGSSSPMAGDSHAHPTDEAMFYVAGDGSDEWSGTLPAPNAACTDGPFATLVRARDAVRQLTAVQSPR